MVEEHTADEDLFNDADKVNEKVIKYKIKEESEENIVILKGMLDNLSKQKELKKKIKVIQEELNDVIIKKYDSLDTTTSKELIINKKWFKELENKFADMYENIIYDFSNQIIAEVENYESTLSQLVKETSDLESLVLKDLERMGY
jgi:hypothetical protein